MGETKINYFTMAENDFHFLDHDYREGRVGNVMCYVAQNICERYLKHLIDIYVTEVSTTDVLKTHSIKILEKFMKTNLPDFKCDWRTVLNVNGYYYSARYPGEDSFMADKSDVDDCWEAVLETRKSVLNYLENNKKSTLNLNKLNRF